MLSAYAKTYQGQKVGFVGLGISNLPVLRILKDAGAICSVRDKKNLRDNPSFAELEREGILFRCGKEYLKNIDEDVLFLSPAVRPDQPDLLDARSRGVRITNEMQEFFSLCPCPIIGITGSDGKTTTTTLTAKLLEASGHRVHLGGNIGKNLLSMLDDIREDDFAVVELSSFQLFKLDRSPAVAAITNLSPNHLDWHTDMQKYADAKENIFAFQNENGLLVLNKDDKHAQEYAGKAHGCVKWISGTQKADIWFDGVGIYRDETLIVRDEELLLIGRYNRYNLAMAICLTEGLVTDEAICKVARTFGGVEHRCELVREKDGVRYYNSSIDSSPSRTAACLKSFAQKVIVICGGYDKNIPLEPLGELFIRHAKHAVLCGTTAEKIERVLQSVGYTDYTRVCEFEKAVQVASSLAKRGDCVVLSPAAASFDMFVNFAQRGEAFKQLVKEL